MKARHKKVYQELPKFNHNLWSTSSTQDLRQTSSQEQRGLDEIATFVLVGAAHFWGEEGRCIASSLVWTPDEYGRRTLLGLGGRDALSLSQ